jgi:hypothetical protein
MNALLSRISLEVFHIKTEDDVDVRPGVVALAPKLIVTRTKVDWLPTWESACLERDTALWHSITILEMTDVALEGVQCSTQLGIAYDFLPFDTREKVQEI